MANTSLPPSYPFDPTGALSSNRITGERQVLTPPDWSDFYFIVPKATPFFAESLQLVLQPSGKILVEGVDYNPSHRFHDASLQCASPVYGSITFLDKTLSGVIEMAYNTLGGDWTVNSTTIAQVLANLLLNPRRTTWEEVVNVPYQFPPIDHEWDLVDMTGGKDIVSAIDRMTVALQQSGDQGLANHLADLNNPHKTTKDQVGLGQVVNLPLASNADAVTGVSTAGYMTPASTTAAIAAQALVPLNAHIASTANPHNVTKTQVGLSAVNNFGWASSAEAQAGTTTNGYMNAALTKTAIDAQAVGPLNTHIGRTDNPHATTATQVGLGNVPNNAMATLAEALAGNATDRFMSPSLVKQVMAGNLGGSLTAHIADHNNPHQVDKTQVGLGNVQNFGVATNAQAIAGVDQATYMTPANTNAAIQDQITPFVNHIGDTGNPHQVTKTQVGLDKVNNFGWSTSAEAQAGQSTAGYMNPELTKEAIQQQVGNAFALHASDTNNPHATTAEQVGAYAIADVDALIATLTNGKLDKTAVAADSNLLGGKTLAQVIASVPVPEGGLLTRVEFEAVDDDVLGTTWTPLAVGPMAGDNADTSPPAVSFYLVGGEERPVDFEKPIYRVHVNLSDVGLAHIEQLSGYRGQLSFGLTFDGVSVTVWVKAKNQRNAMSMLIESGHGVYYTALPDPVTEEPEGFIPYTVEDNSLRGRSAGRIAGNQGFGAPLIFDASASGPTTVYDSYLQNVNVLESGESATAAQAAQVNWADAIPHFQRLAGLGPNVINGGPRIGWRWNPQTSRIVRAGLASFDQLISNQFAAKGGHVIEAIVSSATAGDMAIGLVAGYTDRYGQPQAIHVLRDMGGLTSIVGTPYLRGKVGYKLFSIGYNLFGDDAFDLGSTSTGLIWGDGVADADRAGTPYTTAANGNSNTGWNYVGDVAIRVTVTMDGSSVPSLVFETSNPVAGLTPGSITYVNAAKVTLNLGLVDHPGVADLIKAFQNEGVKWGLCAFRQSDATFQLINNPDKYIRYAALSADADGTDTSVLNSWNGTNWVAQSLLGVTAKPNRLFVSEINQRLYQSCQDGSLQPVNVMGYNGTGRSILTT